MEVSHYNLHPQLVGIVYNMMVFFYVLYSTSKVIMHAQVYKWQEHLGASISPAR